MQAARRSRGASEGRARGTGHRACTCSASFTPHPHWGAVINHTGLLGFRLLPRTWGRTRGAPTVRMADSCSQNPTCVTLPFTMDYSILHIHRAPAGAEPAVGPGDVRTRKPEPTVRRGRLPGDDGGVRVASGCCGSSRVRGGGMFLHPRKFREVFSEEVTPGQS